MSSQQPNGGLIQTKDNTTVTWIRIDEKGKRKGKEKLKSERESENSEREREREKERFLNCLESMGNFVEGSANFRWYKHFEQLPRSLSLSALSECVLTVTAPTAVAKSLTPSGTCTVLEHLDRPIGKSGIFALFCLTRHVIVMDSRWISSYVGDH